MIFDWSKVDYQVKQEIKTQDIDWESVTELNNWYQDKYKTKLTDDEVVNLHIRSKKYQYQIITKVGGYWGRKPTHWTKPVTQLHFLVGEIERILGKKLSKREQAFYMARWTDWKKIKVQSAAARYREAKKLKKIGVDSKN